MDLLVYILPVVILVLSIGYIFANFREKTGIIIIAVVSLLNIAAVVAAIIFAGKLNDQVAQKQGEIDALQVWKEKHIVRLEQQLAKFDPDNETKTQQLKSLIDYGWTIENPVFESSFAAATERIALIASREDKSNQRVEVHNLPPFVDREKISLSLEELGFVVADSSEEEDEESNPQRNVLYYGARVKDENIKVIALSLMKAGVQIRRLKPFKKVTKKNKRTVKLDWKKNFAKRSPITVEKIMSTVKFSRK